MITEIEQETSDISWFFVSGNNIGFVTSFGGRLPDSVANFDEKSELLWSYFKCLPESSDVVINTELESIKNIDITNSYLEDFIYFAKRGLYTFDKTIVNDFQNTNYHLVVKPVRNLSLNALPVEIFNLLSNTLHSGDIEDANEIDIKTFI